MAACANWRAMRALAGAAKTSLAPRVKARARRENCMVTESSGVADRQKE